MPPLGRMKRILQVAALYAVCGALSSHSGALGAPLLRRWPLDATEVLTPLPFALLTGALLLGTSWKAVPATLLQCAAWLAAYSTAIRTVSNSSPYFGWCLAGFVGGLGVVLADSICHPRLLAPKHLAATALMGSVAGLPFAVWSQYSNAASSWAWMCCFAIWQAGVGTYRYVVCTHGTERAEVVNAQEE
jgi:hypothetical protein